MGFGFFGKVPQKGDYLALNLPPAVLGPMESWLADAIASSRQALGQSWHEHYLVAPIWHFWLPPSALGVACTGALVSSVDSGGRYFPALLAYVAAPSRRIAAPDEWESAPWYEAIDRRLLDMLVADSDGYLSTFLTGLEPPAAWDGPGDRALWWRGAAGEAGFEHFASDGLPPASAYAGMLTG